MRGGGTIRKTIFARIAENDLKCILDQGFHFCQMAPSAPPLLSLTLTLGCKNEKQPSGPIELDLEAGNLVFALKLNSVAFLQNNLFVCLINPIAISNQTNSLNLHFL